MSTVWIVNNDPNAKSAIEKIAKGRPGEVIFLTEDEWEAYHKNCEKIERGEPIHHGPEDHHFVPFKDRDDLLGTCLMPGCNRTDAH